MAYTYSKIATVTVGSGGVSSIDFLAIPQNYTDLVLKVSARNGYTGDWSDWLYIKFNNSTTGYSYRLLQGTGISAASYNGTSQYAGDITTANVTANTFGNLEMYIPNYAGSNYKSYSLDAVTEYNASTAIADLDAGLWSNTSPITSINLTPRNSTFNQYSTATLYGIKAEV